MKGGGFGISRSQNGDERLMVVSRQPHNQQHQQQLLPVISHQQLLPQRRPMQIQRNQQQQQQMLLQRPPPPSVAAGGGGFHGGVDQVGSKNFTFTIPPAFLPPPLPTNVVFPPRPLPPQANVTNLDRLLESVSPTVPAKNFYEDNSWGWISRGAELHPFYKLGDLWESFREWSVYGVGVPLVLNEDSIIQYYIPYLSGIQLYVDPLKPLTRPRRPGVESEVGLLRDNVVDNSPPTVSSPSGRLVFEYLEYEQPHLRKPLTDKVSVLASQFPELRMYKSYELLPSSWLCVAWYPIYRIPVGPTLKDLEASFLTFHSLSANFKSKSGQPSGSSSMVTGQKVQLPAFGLASYKLKGSIMTPSGPHECEQENALLQAAGNWLKHLQVYVSEEVATNNTMSTRVRMAELVNIHEKAC